MSMTNITTPIMPRGDTLSEMFAALDNGELDTKPTAPTAPAPVVTDEHGRLTTAVAARSFILGGKATVTLVSTKSGNRFTYRVKASADGRVHFVSLLNGPDNENAYAYFGFIRGGIFFHGGVKAKVAETAASAAGFKWAFAMLARNVLPPSLEIWHEGKCGRCGRKLTVPSSIASGFGPECADRAFGE